MEFFGVFAFIMVMAYSSLPGNVKKLESKVKKLQKGVSNNQKGESVMSKLINDLVGKECIIKSEVGMELVGKPDIKCNVLDADEDWIKIIFKDKKENEITKLIRIESIDEVQLSSVAKE